MSVEVCMCVCMCCVYMCVCVYVGVRWGGRVLMEGVNGMELICNFLRDCTVLYTVSNLDL
jgi:hypothetical protein